MENSQEESSKSIVTCDAQINWPQVVTASVRFMDRLYPQALI